MENIMAYLWIGLAVILAIVEISTVQLVSVWFVVAAIVTAIVSATILYGYLFWQIVVFVLVSLICLILTRPLVRKLKASDKVKTNSDKVIGRKGKVISDIGYNTYTGQVEVDGSKWTAVSTDNSIIKAGSIVTVQEIQGVKLVVKEVKE